MRHNISTYLKDIVAVALLTAFFTSCAGNDFDWLIGTPINVVATTQPVTRAGDNIQSVNFDNGAEINAYYNIIGGESIGNVPTILTAAAADNNGKNRLTPDTQPYYPQEGTIDIMALYPKERANKDMTSFYVESDQREESNYKLSDMMWAGVTELAKTSEDVNLQFTHFMAKMSVTVTGEEGVRIEAISLQNIVRTVDISSLSAASCTLSAVDENGNKEEILLASTEATELENTLSGSGLFPGQTISGNFIKVKTNYGDAYFSLINKEFVGGHEYSASLVVSRQEIGFVTTITDWANNGGSIAVPPGSSAGLKIAAIPDQPYDGTAKTPALTITYSPNDELKSQIGDTQTGTYELVANKDYTAEYFNNTNQGTAVVIITGQKSPDRRGSMEALANVIAGIRSMTSFNITAATGNLEYPATTKTVEYDYNSTVDHTLNTHNGDGTITYSSSDETVADVTNSGVVTIRKAGTTRITASMANDGNYSASTAYYDLTVKKRSLRFNNTVGRVAASIPSIPAGTKVTYSGQPHKPAVIIKDKGRTLQEGLHYTYSVVNNTNVGTATITIKGAGDNYSDADTAAVYLTFEIDKRTPTITGFEGSEVKLAKGHDYTRRAKSDYGSITYTAEPSGFVTVSSDGIVTATNTGSNHASQTVTIYATVPETDNLKSVSASYPLTVVESAWTYSYTGGVQEWTCPISGFWQLEAMGAKGGTTDSFEGGNGADIGGMVYVKEGQKLYIYVGQGAPQTTGTNGNSVIWNGGGRYTGSTASSATSRFTSGGGATDFSLNNGTWDSDTHLNSRILVAGGGGGALYYKVSNSNLTTGAGGAGGGESSFSRAEYDGEQAIGGNNPGGGGTLSSGGIVAVAGKMGNNGKFGNGGNYGGTLSGGAGGGGWFGGASGCQDGTVLGAGGGGSSFIYNTANLATAATGGFNYNLQVPVSDSNFFVKTKAEVEADPTRIWLEIIPTILVAGGSADVNGQARLTYISAE